MEHKTQAELLCPLPWHVSTNGFPEGDDREPAFPGVCDASGRPDGGNIVCSTLGTSEQCKVVSAFIVKACNAHNELVEALRRLEASLECNCPAEDDGVVRYHTNCNRHLKKIAHDALAKL